MNLSRMVALRLLPEGQYAAPGEIARFRAEAVLAAVLRHANIVPVLELGEANAQPCLAFEWVGGAERFYPVEQE